MSPFSTASTTTGTAWFPVMVLVSFAASDHTGRRPYSRWNAIIEATRSWTRPGSRSVFKGWAARNVSQREKMEWLMKPLASRMRPSAAR